MSFRILALVAAAFAIQSALRIRSEETPDARRAGAGDTGVARALGGESSRDRVRRDARRPRSSSGVAFGVSDAAVTGDTERDLAVDRRRRSRYAPAVWVLVGLSVALDRTRAASDRVALGGAGGCFVIGMFGQLLDLPTWIQDISPFQHVPAVPGRPI